MVFLNFSTKVPCPMKNSKALRTYSINFPPVCFATMISKVLSFNQIFILVLSINNIFVEYEVILCNIKG